jgi:hypothetical protein
MKQSRRALSWLMVMMMGILWIGCRTARFDVPSDLASQAPEWTVEGRQRFSFKEAISFGPFRTTDVDRSWTETTSWGAGWFSSSKAKQTYEFLLQETGGPVWEAQCATGVSRQDMRFDEVLGGELEVELQANVYFACSFCQKGEKNVWRLAMSQPTSEMVLNGVLTDRKTRIQVQGSQKLQGSPIPIPDPSGYTFVLDGTLVGAVEVINKGAVWLRPTVDPEIRSVLATASTALLLYKNIGGD